VERDVLVCPERPADIDAIRAVNDAAFRQSSEGKLIDELRRGPTWIPELSRVAIQDVVIGHILFTRITIAESTSALALAPMAVRPSHQRRGIGSLLVQTSLEVARKLGHGIVMVLGHPEYYPRFGFVRARHHAILPPHDWPDAAWMVMPLRDGALEGVKGVVRYPPAFDGV